MKKFLSAFMALIMMLCIIAPVSVSAVSAKDRNPIVYLRGDGASIYDADNKEVYPTGYDMSELPQTAARVLFPYFTNAILFNKWEEYYNAFEKEVNQIFEKAHLDNNGEATNGTGISAYNRYRNDVNSKANYCKADGTTNLFDYNFWYDWRRDPFEVADCLNDYIKGILKATGAEKVSLACRCLGGSFVLAYLEKYGYDDIRSLAIDSTVANGNEKISDLYSGKVRVDGEGMERWLTDLSTQTEDLKFLVEFVTASIDMLNEIDSAKVTEKLINKVYKKLYEGLTPRLCMATFGTWPGYWSSVSAEAFQPSMDLIFGNEKLDYATKYAGLIEKLNNYNVRVRQRTNEILADAKAAGVNVGILAKYGYQSMGFIDSCDELSDSLVSLKKASFGATCSTVQSILSDKYIAEREELGFGKYISIDKQVDASTCLFPDYTWFVKGAQHDNWSSFNDSLLLKICNSKEQFTVNSDETYPQFMVFNKNDGETYPMTKNNCNPTNWDAVQIEKHTPRTFFTAIINFFKSFFALIKNQIGKK
ncbi:MAG: hypothetical protein NC110_03475 [Ruminococcus sp.]|nr:hypothetical protein [Ruminococcus sp.]